MRVNWAKFLKVFAFLYLLAFVVVGVSGCAGVLSIISGMIPSLIAAVDAAISFVVALENKTVPASVSAAVQQWGANVKGFITSLQAIISAAAGQATAGVIAQIQAVMQQIQSSMSSILSEFNVTDSNTVSKFVSLVQIGISFVGLILGLFPAALALMARPDVTEEQLKAEAQEVASQVNVGKKALHDAYKVIRDTPTASADVNAALQTLPTSLP